MSLRVVLIAIFALSLAACGAQGQSGSASNASPGAQATAAASAAPLESGSAAPGTPIAAPTATPDPNLLSVSNGTILRSYSPATLDDMNDGNLGNAANGIGSELPDSAKPPFVFTFELAGTATINGLQADLRSAETNGVTPSVTFAVSATGADSGFTDVGTITGTNTTATANTQARWVRVTANQLFSSVGATGTIASPPSALKPLGVYVQDAYPDKNGAFVATGAHDGDRRVRFVMVGNALVGTQCTADTVYSPYIGELQGRNYNATYPGSKDGNADTFSGAVNDDASIIAGVSFGGSTYFSKTSERPADCFARTGGTGPYHVLVLDQDQPGDFYPADSQPPVGGYTFNDIGAGMLDQSALEGIDAVVTRDVCNVPTYMAPEQISLLLNWVSAGHKLILGGGDCGTGSNFSWVPYPFTSAGSGPESSNAGLVQIENSALGTNDKNDALHFVDVNAYVQNQNNALANSTAVTTTDPHWCGHFFVAKTTNVNGFIQTYAVDGGGMLIFDGFNNDDGSTILQRIRLLELQLPVPASLPCTQLVTSSFILEPSQEATFAAGSATTVTVPMEILANQGWSGTVTIATSGDLPATVTPNSFSLAGGTVKLAVDVKVAASTKPGVYTDTVTADNGAGKAAHASITLTGTASLKKQFPATQKRIRLYGIHFDVDSAVIQPRSEPVIAEIAGIMRESSGSRFQIEGHTDSDGGATYNLGLSQRRAQAVVDDLVKRYGIARSRLVAIGYGLTRPVAANANDAGKALNRRVELVRL